MAPAAVLAGCEPSSFAMCLLEVPGATLLDIFAITVDNPTADPSLPTSPFCNVTVVYTHAQDADTVTVEAWLPAPTSWNQRLHAVGGSGWIAGHDASDFQRMAPIVSEGFVSVTTDAGLGTAQSPLTWPHAPDVGINWPLVHNFAHRALNDEALIVKSLISSFYEEDLLFSYWDGCSQGGRQGLALAQVYPDAFDGIMAHAPAVFMPEIAGAIYGPQQFMNDIGQHPYGCELDAITLATIQACDTLDGVKDGVISDVTACLAHVDPGDSVGKTIQCQKYPGGDPNDSVEISAAAAAVIKATWKGQTFSPYGNESRPIDYGFDPGADVTGNNPSTGTPGTAATACDENGICVGVPNGLAPPWYKYFIKQDPSFNLTTMTRQDFDTYFDDGREKYKIFETANPDLKGFRDAGGKMITFHGLADQIIPEIGTLTYYNAVAKVLPDVHDFYRYFQAPGVAHCGGGSGGYPRQLFAQLQAWVENGTAPESSPVRFTDSTGKAFSRVICPHPKKAAYDAACGQVTEEECWSCVE